MLRTPTRSRSRNLSKSYQNQYKNFYIWQQFLFRARQLRPKSGASSHLECRRVQFCSSANRKVRRRRSKFRSVPSRISWERWWRIGICPAMSVWCRSSRPRLSFSSWASFCRYIWAAIGSSFLHNWPNNRQKSGGELFKDTLLVSRISTIRTFALSELFEIFNTYDWYQVLLNLICYPSKAHWFAERASSHGRPRQQRISKWHFRIFPISSCSTAANQHVWTTPPLLRTL